MLDSHEMDELHEADVPSNARDWRLAIRVLSYLHPHKLQVVASLGLTMLEAPITLLGTVLLGAAVDLYLAPDPSTPPAGLLLLVKRFVEFAGFGGSTRQGILFMALLFVVANLIEAGAEYANTVATEYLGEKLLYDLREEIFAHLQKASIAFYDRNRVGRLMSRITGDVGGLSEMIIAGAIPIVNAVVLICYMLVLMFRLNWRLALVSLAILPLLGVLTTWFRHAARSAYRAAGIHYSRLNIFLHEHLSGMQFVQLFGREENRMAAFDSINKDHRNADLKANLYGAVFYPGIEIVMSIGIALIIWRGGGQVIHGVTTLGTLVAFVQLAATLYNPISGIGENYNAVQSGLASCERIFKLLDEPAVESPASQKVRRRPRGKIEFRHVWFAYRGDDWVLKDVSFVASPGEKIAFVGHTGAGKTTITNLLLRFYEVQRGQILFDDLDIRELDMRELRSNLGVVLQDVFLFSADVASNIRLGNQEITDETIKSAARQVHADDFIMKLPGAYGCKLRERGAGLSVGQKQLLGFARALAFDRCVLILDEATSSIDTEREIHIRDAVKRLMAGRTSLVIAHRLSTIQSVDKIIVMHKGEIREAGNHQALLAQRGLYWRLCQLQFGVEPEAASRGVAGD
jgi:ATP-binding cassette subfamily B multidrug efflux pump